jgi:ABC-type branched-subunit amino acid transport system substrate-binding protein
MRKTVRSFTTSPVCVLTLASLCACTPSPSSNDNIEFGAILTTTGDLAGIGASLLASASLAVKEINASGGVLGRNIQIVNIDDHTEIGGATAAAESHYASGIPAVIGAIGSAWTIEAAEVAANGMVLVSPTSSSPLITDLDDNGYVFRTCPSDALQGRLMAERAISAGIQTAAVIYIEGAYGGEMTATFTDSFVAAGGIVTSSIAYDENQSSYVELWAEVFELSPEAIVMPVYPVDGAQMMVDYNTHFATEDVFFYFADALANDDFVTLVGSDNFSFRYEGTAPSGEGEYFSDFAEAFELEFGESPGIYQSHMYDAVYLVALAAKAAGSLDPAAIRDAMTEVSYGGEQLGPSGAMEIAESGIDFDYQGASGTVDFDNNGDVVAPYAIWVVEDGQITTLEVVSPSQVEEG